MNLFEIKNVAIKKQVPIKTLATDINMSDANLHKCIRDNRIEAGDLEKIAMILETPIEIFFDEAVRISPATTTRLIAAEPRAQYGINRDSTDLTRIIDRLSQMLQKRDEEVEILRNQVSFLKKQLEKTG